MVVAVSEQLKAPLGFPRGATVVPTQSLLRCIKDASLTLAKASVNLSLLPAHHALSMHPLVRIRSSERNLLSLFPIHSNEELGVSGVVIASVGGDECQCGILRPMVGRGVNHGNSED